MALDRSKILQARAELDNNKKKFVPFKNIKRFRPAEGDNRIRILPPWTTQGTNANQFWRIIDIHWNVAPQDWQGLRNFTCPFYTPGAGQGLCLVCRFVQKLRKTKNPSDLELAKVLGARRTAYMNIVDLKDPVWTEQDRLDWLDAQTPVGADGPERVFPWEINKPKVQVFNTGATMRSQIYPVLLSAAEESDFTDLEKGNDIIIHRAGEGKEGTKYSPRISAVSTPLNIPGAKEIMSLLVNLDEEMPMAAQAEIREAMLASGYDPGDTPTRTLSAPVQTMLPLASPPVDDVNFERSPPVKALSYKNNSKHAVTDDTAKPSCYADGKTRNSEDPECVGGEKAGLILSPCPFWDPCGAENSAQQSALRRQPVNELLRSAMSMALNRR